MATGEVLFHRDGEQESDVWDDSALVKAYDKAVTQMKDQLGLTGSDKGTHANKQNKNQRKRKNKKKKGNKGHGSCEATLQWRVGDRCRGIFSEDGLLYEAKIIALHDDGAQCTVRYLGYGNEEDLELCNLLPAGEDFNSTGNVSECDSMEWHNTRVSTSRTSTPRPGSRSTTTSRPGSGRGRGANWAWPHMPTMPGMTPQSGMHPMMPPMFPPMPPNIPGWSQPPMMPAMPPPPPVDEDLVSSDKEALHSMLISWYMSGYHTGYYQGLKQGKASGSRHQHHRNQKHRNDSAADER